MRKKRKAWWIGGGVGLVVLFTVAALAMREDSADRKLEAKLNEIFRQYGFEKYDKPQPMANGMLVPTYVYMSEGRTAAEVGEILATIADVCQGCANYPDPMSFDGAGLHLLDAGVSYRSIGYILVYVSMRPIGTTSDDIFQIDIGVAKLDPPFWDRITNLWPW